MPELGERARFARPIKKDTLKTFQSFDTLNLPPPLANALKQMKFMTPTPVQVASIPQALEGKDILGTAQTGTGKTGAFGIPVLAQLYKDPSKRALILAPTRELAAQIHSVFRRMASGTDISGVLLVGGESFNRQVREIGRRFDYIVATPGRLNDHLEQRTLSLSRIELLVLDEVDRMLDMGFIAQVKRIVRHVSSVRQTLLFSATFPAELKTLADGFLRNPVRVEIGQMAIPVETVTEETLYTTEEGKKALILKELESRKGRTLVFARTKRRATLLAKLIHQKGHNVVFLHGGRSQSQRQDALKKFRLGTHRIMVATDLAGRGIDVVDIEHVINYDVPATREDYIHRVGRTARCGKGGKALNLLISGDVNGEQIISGKKPPARVIYRTKRWPARRSHGNGRA